MTPQEKNQKKLEKLFSLMDSEAITRDDFNKSFESIVNLILKIEKGLMDKNTFAVDSLNKLFDSLSKKLETATDTKLSGVIKGLKDSVGKALKEQENGLNFLKDKVRNLKDGKSVDVNEVVEKVLTQIQLPEQKDILLDTGEIIVDKINDLNTKPENQIDASHIKNLPKQSGQGGLVAVTKPLAWYDENTLLSEYVNKIKLSGAGIQGSLDTDGTLIITVVGGTGTFADELMTDSGDHTIFTILHTPTTGTLLVINENTGQAIPTSAYTNVGTNITFTSSQEVDGETPIFRARYSYS